MRVALVTGGSRGIGAAVARRLAREGCQVVVNYLQSEDRARALAGEIGGVALRCDVSDPAAVHTMVEEVLHRFCQLDILVCAAGVAWQGLTQDMGVEDYRRLMGVDLDGTFFCCREALPPMIRRKSGRIVTISSMWGQTGASCETAYSAAKAGVIGLTKALAKEVGPSGITVNCVAPGVIDTDMNRFLGPEALAELAAETPLGRLGDPREAAAAVAWLCSEEAAFVTGQVLPVNGGLVI